MGENASSPTFALDPNLSAFDDGSNSNNELDKGNNADIDDEDQS